MIMTLISTYKIPFVSMSLLPEFIYFYDYKKLNTKTLKYIHHKVKKIVHLPHIETLTVNLHIFNNNENVL